MLRICILAMAGLFAALIVKKDKPEYATLIIMLVGFLIAVRVLGVMEEVVREINGWRVVLSDNVVYINFLLKLIGITYICEFAANLCRDSGYAALSSHIELFGKVTIMIAGFPVIRTMIKMLEEVMR
ncbi:MAG: stage III sporulation protein AD [Roseburia sp.]|nr:stage III sporulation protein AD [Roseburia sp.]